MKRIFDMSIKMLNIITSSILATFSLLFQSCSQLGELVNKDISDSYFYSNNKKCIIFSPAGNWLELGKTKLADVDTETFTVLSTILAKDKNRVYYKGQAIKLKVDLPNFRLKSDEIKMSFYPIDNQHVYTFNGLVDAEMFVVEDADPASFTAIDFNWSKDAKHLFYKGRKTNLDLASFAVLNDEFCVDKQHLYLQDKELVPLDISFDLASIKALDHKFIYDKEYLFVRVHFFENGNDTGMVHQIKYDDIESFDAINSWCFSLDGKDFIMGRTVTEVPKQHFQLLADKQYALTESEVFWNGAPIKGADRNSFELLANSFDYAKDKDFVYYQDMIVEGANPATFQAVENKPYYFSDGKNKYKFGKRIDK